MLPSELIADATALAFPHIREDQVSRGMLLRQINVIEREVMQFLLIQAPQLVDTPGSDVAIVESSNAAGYTLPAHLWIGDFQYMDSSKTVTPLKIYNEADYDNPPSQPSAIIRGVKLFPCDPQKQRWAGTGQRGVFVNGDLIHFSYIAPLVQITALSTPLLSPEETRNYFVHNLTLSILLVSEAPKDRLMTTIELITDARSDYKLVLARKQPNDSGMPSTLRSVDAYQRPGYP